MFSIGLTSMTSSPYIYQPITSCWSWVSVCMIVNSVTRRVGLSPLECGLCSSLPFNCLPFYFLDTSPYKDHFSTSIMLPFFFSQGVASTLGRRDIRVQEPLALGINLDPSCQQCQHDAPYHLGTFEYSIWLKRFGLDIKSWQSDC